jgi:putative CocE/NonD family hydrolase
MGAVGEPDAPGNVWRSADDFPPAHRMTPLYLEADGRLTSDRPTAADAKTDFLCDPRNPMQIPGTAFPGAADAREFEQQAEVRTFTTEVLEQPVEWTGRIRANLFLSSTARDADILVRVSDVYPDGRSILIVDYPLRLRYRDGFDHEVLMQPGEVVQAAFDVGWISQIFNRGHRIRVTVSGPGAPLYEPNPQTGGPQTNDLPPDAVSATHSIQHNRTWASSILAPVVATANEP